MATKGTQGNIGRNELHVVQEKEECVTLAWCTPLLLFVSYSLISCRMRVQDSRWCSGDHGSPCARSPCG